MANCPTGPQPQTATVSPGWICAVFRGHVAGRKDVGQEQHLLVARASYGHLERTHVRERHAHVLGLAAGVAAGEVRVAECSPHVEWPQQLLAPARRSGWSCRTATQLRAGSRSSAPHAMANGTTTRSPTCEVLAPRPDLDHLAHELVAEDVARLPWSG